MRKRDNEWIRIDEEGYPPSVNWDEQQGIQGKILEIKAVTFKDGQIRRCMVLETQTGKVTVWETLGLQPLFQKAVEGQEVMIEFAGWKQNPRTKRRMRSFIIHVKRLM